MRKPKKVNVHVRMSEEVWEKTRIMIDEMGFTNSGFFEMVCKQMIKAETSPLGNLIEDILKDLFEHKTASKKGKK